MRVQSGRGRLLTRAPGLGPGPVQTEGQSPWGHMPALTFLPTGHDRGMGLDVGPYLPHDAMLRASEEPPPAPIERRLSRRAALVPAWPEEVPALLRHLERCPGVSGCGRCRN